MRSFASIVSETARDAEIVPIERAKFREFSERSIFVVEPDEAEQLIEDLFSVYPDKPRIRWF